MHWNAGTISGYQFPLLRIRYQLFIGLVLALGLPVALRMAVDSDAITINSLRPTLIAAAVAHLAGFAAYRRLGTFPGVAAIGAILPTFALTYGTAFLVIFFFRFDYSRFQAAGSFLISVLWYLSMIRLGRHLEPYRLAILPGGRANDVRSMGNIIWTTLASPNVLRVRAQGVVADLRTEHSDEWVRFMADCALAGIPVYHYKHVNESLTGRVSIESLSENTLGSLNPDQIYRVIKNALDWFAALAALIILSPILAIIALAIRLDTPGPAFFVQPRVGYRGNVFPVFKFRTMRVQSNVSAGGEREAAITQTDDRRITPLGRVLRKTRIDELPQLLNVLRGEMSWIGPRPEAVPLSSWYETELPFYRYRHIVRPGITGWAQVNQGHVATVEGVSEKLNYDFYYIKNFSPWLDALIVMKTARIMFTGNGAK